MTSQDTQQKAITAKQAWKGALAGMAAGAVASFAMDRFQAAISSMSASNSESEPATEKAAQAIVHVATGSEISKEYKPLAGQIVHYSLGIALGAAYGAAAEHEPRLTAGHGTAFGVAVTVLLDEAAVPALGLGPPPWKTPARTHLYTLISHLIFGTVTETTRQLIRSALT